MNQRNPVSLHRRTVLVGAVSTFALAACGASERSTGGGGSASGGRTDLTIGEFSWSAAAIETQILIQLAKKDDLGVGTITTKKVDPAVGWTGLGRGDLDVLPEVNLPNQQQFADKNAKTTTLVSETYGGAVQGWFVPKYLVEPGGAAAGLTSVDQLKQKKYADAVGGALYDADPGWVTTQQNTARIKAFDLPLEHKASSEAAELAQLKRAYDAKDPILVYLYRPHWVFNKYDLVQLTEPKPYVKGAFEKGGPSDVAIPTLSAHIAARTDLKQRAPKFYALLQKFRLPLTDVEKLLAEQQAKPSLTAADLADQWIKANQAKVDSWVK